MIADNELSKYTIAVSEGDSTWFANTKHGSVARISNSRLHAKHGASDQGLRSFLSSAGFLSSESHVSETTGVQSRMQAAKSEVGFLDVTLAPTLGCNFSCYYCFEKKTDQFVSGQIVTDETSKEILNFIVSNLRGREGLRIRWFGGEPLLALERMKELSKTLMTICELSGKRYEAQIQTNAFLLNESTVNTLKELGISQVQVTLDGDEERHNMVRNTSTCENSYRAILANIEIALRHIDAITVRINVTGKNQSSILQAISDLAAVDPNRRLNIYAAPVYSHFNGVLKQATTSVGFSRVQEFAEFELDFIEHLLALGYPFSWRFLEPRALPCSALKVDAVMIGPDGNIYKCDHELGVPALRSGHVRTGADRIGRLSKWISIHPRDNEFCSTCVLLPTCHGYCASVRKFAPSQEQACPSKKFNFERRIRLGAENARKRGHVEDSVDMQLFFKPSGIRNASSEDCQS